MRLPRSERGLWAESAGVLAGNGDHQQDVWGGNSRQRHGLGRLAAEMGVPGKGQQGPSALLRDFTFSPVGDVVTSHSYRSWAEYCVNRRGSENPKGLHRF